MPLHVQDQGPEPETEEAVPDEQSPLVGVEYKYWPFEAPQFPAANGALQDAADPPYCPKHDHVQGPDPDVPEYVPEEQKFEVGAVKEATPLEEPQEPLTGLIWHFIESVSVSQYQIEP